MRAEAWQHPHDLGMTESMTKQGFKKITEGRRITPGKITAGELKICTPSRRRNELQQDSAQSE